MVRQPLDAGALPRPPALLGARKPCWFTLQSVSGEARQCFAAEPSRVVMGSDVAALEAAWRDERSAWGTSPGPELPIGVGYLSYDLGRTFERLRGDEPPRGVWPDLEFRFYDAVCIHDSQGAVIYAKDAPAARDLAGLLNRGATQAGDLSGMVLHEEEPAERHLSSVRRALDYILAGDIYQVNLARRLRCDVAACTESSLALAERLAVTAPSPFAFWCADRDSGRALVGNSPERFVRWFPDGRIETCPIKGTRRRGAGRSDDEVRAELLASGKDRAEHVMIVDLERNDLGRVCRTGSVHVAALCTVLNLPTVFHLESTVAGIVREGIGLAELLRAVFPGGSVTGAPKIRAMEIIDELEPACRGPYTGATGWLGAAGDLDLAVAIRTAEFSEGRMTLWVGGGIVAESDPHLELEETWAKAGAFTSALG